ANSFFYNQFTFSRVAWHQTLGEHMQPRYINTSTAVIALFLCAQGSHSQQATVTRPPVEVQMRNVTMHVNQLIVLEIRSLRGQMAPTNESKPVTLDDVNSFVTRIDSAEIAMS